MSVDIALEVELVPILSDNYAFLIRDPHAETVGVVDPGDAAPIEAAINARGGRLDWILLTHHHNDHIAGAEPLRQSFGAKIAGAEQDAKRLPSLDAALRPGEDWGFGGQLVEIIDAPGHTIGHIAYHFPRGKALFSGDALFALGCGRLFEGAAAQLWGALSTFATLPPETKVYCGHEYTLSNARFAAGVEPENLALQERVGEIEAARADNQPTVPTTIGREIATNPFMRANEPSVKAAMGLPDGDPAAVFAELRRRKDAV